jgi:hypothetical protein
MLLGRRRNGKEEKKARGQEKVVHQRSRLWEELGMTGCQDGLVWRPYFGLMA